MLQENVLGLDVAVYDAPRVRMVECIRYLVGDSYRLADRQAPFAREPRAQCLAVDERHDVPEQTVSAARVEQR